MILEEAGGDVERLIQDLGQVCVLEGILTQAG
jgi:hypothetical protein